MKKPILALLILCACLYVRACDLSSCGTITKYGLEYVKLNCTLHYYLPLVIRITTNDYNTSYPFCDVDICPITLHNDSYGFEVRFDVYDYTYHRNRNEEWLGVGVVPRFYCGDPSDLEQASSIDTSCFSEDEYIYTGWKTCVSTAKSSSQVPRTFCRLQFVQVRTARRIFVSNVRLV